jgi:hypothetical protein
MYVILGGAKPIVNSTHVQDICRDGKLNALVSSLAEAVAHASREPCRMRREYLEEVVEFARGSRRCRIA